MKIKTITFPKEEWTSILNRLNNNLDVYTIRIFTEFNK